MGKGQIAILVFTLTRFTLIVFTLIVFTLYCLYSNVFTVIVFTLTRPVKMIVLKNENALVYLELNHAPKRIFVLGQGIKVPRKPKKSLSQMKVHYWASKFYNRTRVRKSFVSDSQPSRNTSKETTLILMLLMSKGARGKESGEKSIGGESARKTCARFSGFSASTFSALFSNRFLTAFFSARAF